jgi:hypothetical protein
MMPPMRRRSGRTAAGAGLSLVLALVALALPSRAQDASSPPPIDRPGPPAREDFETDTDGDNVPDGWYNLRDASWVDQGGPAGPHCLRFENARPSRPARASRAFGIDGRATEAVVISLWVRLENTASGERIGEEPGLMLDMLDDQVRPIARRPLGPWSSRDLGTGWVRVGRRLSVPEAARDAILTVGLLGGTGVMEVDGLTITTIARGGTTTANLVLNGDQELGTDQPDHWVVEGDVSRVFPGRSSDSALELSGAGAKASIGLGVPASRFDSVEVRASVKGSRLRATGGAIAMLYALDADGRVLGGGVPVARWSGSFDWTDVRRPAPIPRGADRAVLQFEKIGAEGSLQFDQVEVVSRPDPRAGTWSPYRERDRVAESWPAFQASASIEPGSALDASFLLDAPAGKSGRVVVREGRLAFESGGRARFFGVTLMPPMAFEIAERADATADRLARSGVNLVRLAGLDAPLGPGVSLFDDTRDDTRALDPVALQKLDHLIAALKARGIYVSIELQGLRRFRAGDGLEGSTALPFGGGPALAFDAELRQRTVEAARMLLSHRNPETKLALQDDPALALVTLSGEMSLFDRIDDPKPLPEPYEGRLKAALAAGDGGGGRKGWQALEASQWAAGAQALRDAGLKTPIAGSSHWRREPEFSAAQAAAGLDFVDDRLYWAPLSWSPPDRRSPIWERGGGFGPMAARKRKTDRPYVAGETAEATSGAWAAPFDAAGLLATAATAEAEDWDAVVRRGVAARPLVWGAAAPGPSGENDLMPILSALNASPSAFAMLPHAASIVLRGRQGDTNAPAARRRPVVVEMPGVLAVATPHTVALAGWTDGRPWEAAGGAISIGSIYGAVALTAIGPEPLAQAKRVLVTAVGRSQTTGQTWADGWRRDIADLGRPPIRLEPTRARVLWKRKTTGAVQAYRLDASGQRGAPVPVRETAEGSRVVLDESAGGPHWELVVE